MAKLIPLGLHNLKVQAGCASLHAFGIGCTCRVLRSLFHLALCGAHMAKLETVLNSIVYFHKTIITAGITADTQCRMLSPYISLT